MKITNFNLPSFKEASYFTCIKTPCRILKAATAACQDTFKHIYTNAMPAYIFSNLTHQIYIHAENVLSKAPTCLSTHMIITSILESPKFVFNKILSGEVVALLPHSIKQQIFGISKKEAKQTMQELLCQPNSLEIAQEYLRAHLKDKPQETKQLFCDDKSIEECAQNYRETCQSQTAHTATDAVCSDLMSDIAMIQGGCRVLSVLLAGAFICYFAKNLLRSEKPLEKASVQAVLDDPKTIPIESLTTSKEPVSVTKKLNKTPPKNASIKEPPLTLDQLFSYPNLDEDLIKNLKEKIQCHQ